MNKICKSCLVKKQLSDFFKDKRGYSGGYMAICKSCKTKKLYEWREKNPEKWRSYMRQQYKIPHVKERIEKYRRTGRAKEMARERERLPALKAYRKKYLLDHPEKAKAFDANRHFRRRIRTSNFKKLSDVDIENMFKKHGRKCHYCGSLEKITLDHYVPVSKGGSNNISNIVPACKSCNSAKKDMMPMKFKNRMKYGARRK